MTHLHPGLISRRLVAGGDKGCSCRATSTRGIVASITFGSEPDKSTIVLAALLFLYWAHLVSRFSFGSIRERLLGDPLRARQTTLRAGWSSVKNRSRTIQAIAYCLLRAQRNDRQILRVVFGTACITLNVTLRSVCLRCKKTEGNLLRS